MPSILNLKFKVCPLDLVVAHDVLTLPQGQQVFRRVQQPQRRRCPHKDLEGAHQAAHRTPTQRSPPIQVCTKVASFLEQGQRLENLSWRLWHLQNLMVDTDNAKSKREFKKLSKCMGDKLDKEKGR